jgi:hypothetical protein
MALKIIHLIVKTSAWGLIARSVPTKIVFGRPLYSRRDDFRGENKGVNFLKAGNQPLYAHQILHTASREHNLEFQILTDTREHKPHNEGASIATGSLSHILLPPGTKLAVLRGLYHLVTNGSLLWLLGGTRFWKGDAGVPGSIPGHYKKVVGLERGPLSLVSITEELLDIKVAAPV